MHRRSEAHWAPALQTGYLLTDQRKNLRPGAGCLQPVEEAQQHDLPSPHHPARLAPGYDEHSVAQRARRESNENATGPNAC